MYLETIKKIKIKMGKFKNISMKTLEPAKA